MTVFNSDISSSGVFLSRQLEQRLPKLYEKKYPELKFTGEFLPVNFSLESGASDVVEEYMSVAGESSVVAAYSTDISVSDANIEEQKYPVICQATAVRYSVRELLASEKSGRSVRGLRELSARRVLEESINKLGAFGNKARGIKGLLNHPEIPIYSESANLYNSTPDQQIEALTSYVSRVVRSSNMAEAPDTMIVPVALHEQISTRRIPDAANTTVKSFILQNNTWLKNILPCNEVSSDMLEQYGVNPVGTNRDLILVYSRSPENVERFAEPLQTMQPQLNGMHWSVIFYYCSTGVIPHYPGGNLYVSIPKAA